MPNLQHKVLLKNMLHAMQGRCYCICIPLFKKGKKKKRLLLTPKCARISWNTREKKGCFHPCGILSHISSTHPNTLSVSGSSFILKETFIHVGAIFSNNSCTGQLSKPKCNSHFYRKKNEGAKK